MTSSAGSVSLVARVRTLPARVLASGNALRVLSVIVVLAIWEVLGREAPIFMSYPTAVVVGFYQIAFARNEVLPALQITLTALVVGFTISAVLGIAIGLAMGLVRTIEIVLDPYISAIYSTPRIVLVPVFILWLGIGFEVRVTMAVVTSIFPIIINTYTGVKSVDPELLDTGRAFTATRWQTLRTVVAPASVPLIFTGLRIGISRALEGVIIAEMTAAVVGTGYLLLNYGRYFQTDKLMGPIILIGLVSIGLARLIKFAEHRLMPWASLRGDS